MRFKDLKIGTRLNLVVGGFLVVAFAFFGIYVNSMMQRQIIDTTDERMKEQVNDLVEVIAVELSANQERIELSLQLARTYFERQGELTEVADEYISYSATDQITGAVSSVQVNQWLLNGNQLQNQFDVVDAIHQMGVPTATIFQKIPQGYLRISTNVMDGGRRATGTFIPADAPVARAIDRGQTYTGRAWVVNDWYLTAYEPISIDGEIKGMLYVGMPEKNLEQIKQLFNNKVFFDTGYPYIVDAEGTLVVHPTSEGANISNESFFQTKLANRTGQIIRDEYVWQGDEKIQYFRYYEPIDSFVSTSFYTSEMNALLWQFRFAILIVTLISIGVVLLVLRVVVLSVVRPLAKGVKIAETVAQGNLTLNIDKSLVDQKDEIGQLAQAMHTMVEKLREVMGSVVAGSDNIAAASQQMSSTAQEMSQGSTEQASSAEEVSSSMEEMAANIQQNTDNARETEKISQNVSEGIKEVGSASIESLESIKLIASKISIIGEISRQTNILALNAAVEAARAGEHGRGFAVVAAEVRKLAENSKVAADEINLLAKRSVDVTEKAGALMQTLMPEVDKTARLVQEIAAASLEQNSGADQINSAIQQLNQVTQQNAAASEEMATSSEELSSQADQLLEMVSYFKLDQQGAEKAKMKTETPLKTAAKPRITANQKYDKPSSAKTLHNAPNPTKSNGGGIKLDLGKTKDDEYERF